MWPTQHNGAEEKRPGTSRYVALSSLVAAQHQDPLREPGGSIEEGVPLTASGIASRQHEEKTTLSRASPRGVLLAIAVTVCIAAAFGMGWTWGSSESHQTSSELVLSGLVAPGRTYFIAADKVNWDYAPSGKMRCYPPGFAAMPPGVSRIGGTFVKAQYREYTDSSFKTLKPSAPEWQHLGSVGPVMYAAVGDVLRVVFRNNLPYSVNVAPTGGLVTADGAGLTREMACVQPGHTVTYLWAVSEAAGPEPGSTVSSRMWLYRSSVDPVRHDNAGLVGPVIVTSRGNARPDGRARDVDRDVVSIFAVVDEKASAHTGDHSASLTSGAASTKYVINGWEYCNMPAGALTLDIGQRVRWHAASVGSHDGLHNFHWHGHVVELNGHHVDQFTAIPTASYSVNMVPEEPGNWIFHCHVNAHMGGGMVDLYTVVGTATPHPAVNGTERVYYVAAEEVDWNYAPLGVDHCANPAKPFTPGTMGYTYLAGPSASSAANGTTDAAAPATRFGSTLTKTLYVEYTDETFTTAKPRPAEDAYLGFMGPVMRAVVGDTIKVVFRNRGKVPTSIHAHGVRYTKAHEGTLYEDGSDPSDKGDDVVAPGQSYTYVWQARELSGPGPSDPSSLLWIYHGHVDEAAETNAGLMGGIIITGRGMARSPSDLRPIDVDREVVVLLTVTNETDSSNFMTNLKRVDNATAADPAALQELLEDPGFQGHMLRHSINGFMYCNMPHLNFSVGERLRLHVMSFGSLDDTHTPHMGGPRFEYNGQHSDSIQISPGGMLSADVALTSPGTYELQCRVAHHIMAGMRALYSVLPRPAPASSSASTTASNSDPTSDSDADSDAGSGSDADADSSSASTPPPAPAPSSSDSNPATAPAPTTPLSGTTRTYFIQAEPLDWDYAPDGYVKCTEVDLSSKAMPYLMRSASSMGSKYRKAVYREYADETYSTPNPSPHYFGITGPLIIAEVGDKLEVHFRNALSDLPDYPVNLSPGGGLVDDGTDASCAGGQALAAGAHCVYRWIVPDSAGPGPADFNTVAYGYTSTVDVVTAPNAGLVGALLVAGRGHLITPRGAGGQLLPHGVDVLVPLYFQVMDENSSPYLIASAQAAGINMTAMGGTKDGHSMHSTTSAAAHEDQHGAHTAMDAADFFESNRMHAINGYTYCNLPHLNFTTGTVVRWVMMAYGSESEFHSPYFANQVVQVDRIGWSTLASLMPSTVRVADMRAGAVGKWMLFCDVHHDYLAGMLAQFEVLP